MSVFGNIFGSKKAMDDIVDKDNGLLVQVGSWVGGMTHTEEEKAEANASQREWGLEWIKALHPFKVVQRIIAFNTMFVWSILALNLIVAVWYDQLNRCLPSAEDCVPPGATKAMIAIIVTPFVAYPIISVVSLYMSGGVLPEIFNRKKK